MIQSYLQMNFKIFIQIIHISIQICEYELEWMNDMNAHIFYFHIHSSHHNDQIVILVSNYQIRYRTIDEYT